MSDYLRIRALLVPFLLAVTLSGCGSSDSGAAGKSATGNSSAAKSASSVSATPTSAAASPSVAADAVSELHLGTTSAGPSIVDQSGRAIYLYDGDVKDSGGSSCDADCSTQFPPVHVNSTPTLTGLTLTLGAVSGSDGDQQLTINGLPVYYFAGDTAAGLSGGQAKDRMWWTLDENGNANST